MVVSTFSFECPTSTILRSPASHILDAESYEMYIRTEPNENDDESKGADKKTVLKTEAKYNEQP